MDESTDGTLPVSGLRFDDPEHDLAMAKVINLIIAGITELDPVLGRIPKRPIHHAGPMRTVHGTEIIDRPLEVIEYTMTLSTDGIKHTDIEEFVVAAYDMAHSQIEALKKMLFNLVAQTTKSTGNVVSTGGEPLTLDHLVDVLELMSIDFDEAGEAIIPTLFANPKTIEYMRMSPPTLAQKQRLDDVMAKKKEEYFAQKRTRRLSSDYKGA